MISFALFPQARQPSVNFNISKFVYSITCNSENHIFIRGKAPELKKHIYISVNAI